MFSEGGIMQIFRVESRFNFITSKGKKAKTTFGPYFTPCIEIDESTADDVKNIAFYKNNFTPFDHEDSKHYSHRRCTSPYEDLKLSNLLRKEHLHFGFERLSDLLRWFRGDLDSLHDAGFHVGIYEISYNEAFLSRNQTMFNSHKANMVGFISLEELFYAYLEGDSEHNIGKNIESKLSFV